MGRGGARRGAGRKPKFPRAVEPGQAVAGRIAPAAAVDPSLATPPDGLPATQKAVWTEYAPAAIERRTLIASTVPAFQLLCEAQTHKVTAELKAATGGVSEMRVYLALVKQIESLMDRFALAPNGKPVAVAGPKTMSAVERFRQSKAGA